MSDRELLELVLEMVTKIESEQKQFREETMARLDTIQNDQKSIHEILGEHEVSIRTLRRIPVYSD